MIILIGMAAWAIAEAVNLGTWLKDLGLKPALADPRKFNSLAGFLKIISGIVALLSIITAFLLWRLIQMTTKFNRALAISRQSHNRYRFLAEAPPSVGMVRLALVQRKFLDANRTVLRMLGLARGEFVGESLDSFIHPEDKRDFQRQIERLKSGERTLEFTVRMSDVTGEVMDIQWHLARTQTTGPEIEAVAILTDVSERRRAEAERAEKERLQGVLEMAGAAAHELNQPMQVILAYTTILSQKMDSSDPNYKLIAKLKEEADRMERIGKKIATISKYKVKSYVGDTKIIDIDQASSY